MNAMSANFGGREAAQMGFVPTSSVGIGRRLNVLGDARLETKVGNIASDT